MEAHLYEQLASQEDQHWWFKGRRAVIRKVLEQYLPPAPRRILDIGCGTGGMLPMLREFGQVEGLEGSKEAIALCRQRMGGDVVIYEGRIPDAIPSGQRYDVITAFDVLEHLDDPVDAIAAARQALRPGGVFICTVPAFQFLWSAHDTVHHHKRRYTESLLRGELRAGGLAPVWTSYFNSFLFPPIAAVRLLGNLRKRSDADGGHGASDVANTPAPLNAALAALFSAERHLLPRLRLPVGVSLVGVARAAAH